MLAPLTEVLWDQLLTVVHDEDPPHVQLDVVLLLLVLKKVKWGAARDKEQGAEFQLTLDGEVLRKKKKVHVMEKPFIWDKQLNERRSSCRWGQQREPTLTARWSSQSLVRLL